MLEEYNKLLDDLKEQQRIKEEKQADLLMAGFETMLEGDEELILSKKIRESGTKRNRNLMIAGAAGTGKSDLIFANMMQRNGSYIVHDVYGSVRESANYFESFGYKVKILDFLDMNKSNRYNPFRYVENKEDLNALAEALYEAEGGSGNISSPFTEEDLDRILHEADFDTALSLTKYKLQILGSDMYYFLTGMDDIDIDKAAEEKTIIIVVTDGHSEESEIAAAMFFSQAMRRLTMYADNKARKALLVRSASEQILKVFNDGSEPLEEERKAAEWIADMDGAYIEKSLPGCDMWGIKNKNGKLVGYRGSKEQALLWTNEFKSARITDCGDISPIHITFVLDDAQLMGKVSKLADYMSRQGRNISMILSFISIGIMRDKYKDDMNTICHICDNLVITLPVLGEDVRQWAISINEDEKKKVKKALKRKTAGFGQVYAEENEKVIVFRRGKKGKVVKKFDIQNHRDIDVLRDSSYEYCFNKNAADFISEAFGDKWLWEEKRYIPVDVVEQDDTPKEKEETLDLDEFLCNCDDIVASLSEHQGEEQTESKEESAPESEQEQEPEPEEKPVCEKSEDNAQDAEPEVFVEPIGETDQEGNIANEEIEENISANADVRDVAAEQDAATQSDKEPETIDKTDEDKNDCLATGTRKIDWLKTKDDALRLVRQMRHINGMMNVYCSSAEYKPEKKNKRRSKRQNQSIPADTGTITGGAMYNGKYVSFVIDYQNSLVTVSIPDAAKDSEEIVKKLDSSKRD